jgi:hypothetical protein
MRFIQGTGVSLIVLFVTVAPLLLQTRGVERAKGQAGPMGPAEYWTRKGLGIVWALVGFGAWLALLVIAIQLTGVEWVGGPPPILRPSVLSAVVFAAVSTGCYWAAFDVLEVLGGAQLEREGRA